MRPALAVSASQRVRARSSGEGLVGILRLSRQSADSGESGSADRRENVARRAVALQQPGFRAGRVPRKAGQDYGLLRRADLVPAAVDPDQTTVGGTPGATARGYEDGEPVAPWDLAAMPGTGNIGLHASRARR